jgi:hypothetical protein
VVRTSQNNSSLLQPANYLNIKKNSYDPAAGIQATTTEHGGGFHQRQDMVHKLQLYAWLPCIYVCNLFSAVLFS